MAAVGWTQTDIDTLRAAIASGILTVLYEGPPKRSITYQSVSAMERILARALREVNGTPAFRLAGTRKGV